MRGFPKVVPLAVLIALMGASVAMAQPAPKEGAKRENVAERGVHHVEHGAESVLGRLESAYHEVIHAHRKAAVGENAAAQSHLEAAKRNLAQVPPEQLTPETARDLKQIEQELGQVEISKNRAQATQQTKGLVSRFVGLFSHFHRREGGGAGTAGRMEAMGITSFEALGAAADESASTQAAAATGDWSRAQQHARNAVEQLDASLQAAQKSSSKLTKAEIQQLQSIRNEAGQVQQLAQAKSDRTQEAAGKLVSRIGDVTPSIAMTLETPAGGGAGTPPKR